MTTSPDLIIEAISEATSKGFRDKLVAQGQARAAIWRYGTLPPETPIFSPQLSFNLHSYAYGLLGLGLRLLELKGDQTQTRIAFHYAATALEAVMAKGDRANADSDFHFVMAAASYHLAHLSARSYSLIVKSGANFSPIEQTLALLIQRDITKLRERIYDFKLEGRGSDATIAELLQQGLTDPAADAPERSGQDFLFEGLDLALTDAFFSAFAMFLLALDRGERSLMDQAITQLRKSLDICTELNLLPQWWVHRVTIPLLSDLWENTFHEKIPLGSANSIASAWPSLRELFIAILMRRQRAEVGLWPSQIEAAARILDPTDNLVVSLPTSAGKTRIAELSILRCLADGRRVVFVTPLRALSSQTETTLHRTFAPLGKTISALYGSIGMFGFDEDASKCDIVIATPEKLDFAFRNDPSLLDDVGLLVFDEGHMIGPKEREVRYEVLIQRLLHRQDADQRRIVCLSAILPDGDQMEDFSAWLRRDQLGQPIKNNWRPTQQRFGEVIWDKEKSTACLTLHVEEENPSVPKFLTGVVKKKPSNQLELSLNGDCSLPSPRMTFPNNQLELSLATAWQLVGDGQTVLIYCPERRSVESFAKCIVELNLCGALKSLVTGGLTELQTAIALGGEWLGKESNILKCLELGVALNHAALPTAYRKEIEHLLRKNILKIIISSPTLAQGLNLSATTVIMHSLYRSRKKIEVSEFKNVIGRAGRAYSDLEGLVLFPIFKDIKKQKCAWLQMIKDQGAHNIESGLVQLICSLLTRMHKKQGGDFKQLIDYVINNAEAWTFPEVAGDNPENCTQALTEWERHIETLDTAILSLIGGDDVPDDQIEMELDKILQSSLWNRCLRRKECKERSAIRAMLLERSKYIWKESTPAARRGYFLAGLSLNSGQKLDKIAPEANSLLIDANTALMMANHEEAITAITGIAKLVFTFYPFKPDPLPDNWQKILRCWLLGSPLLAKADKKQDEMWRFIENGLIYRLPWAMEALRVRATVNSDVVDMSDLS